jgi:hypothetical protein
MLALILCALAYLGIWVLMARYIRRQRQQARVRRALMSAVQREVT